MSKIRRYDMHPIFKATKQRVNWSNIEMDSIHIIDTLAIMKYDNLTYNTLETARFKSWLEIVISRTKSKIKWEEGKINSVKITT